MVYIVATELKDPICHSDECQIGSFSSEATICYDIYVYYIVVYFIDVYYIDHVDVY